MASGTSFPRTGPFGTGTKRPMPEAENPLPPEEDMDMDSSHPLTLHPEVAGGALANTYLGWHGRYRFNKDHFLNRKEIPSIEDFTKAFGLSTITAAFIFTYQLNMFLTGFPDGLETQRCQEDSLMAKGRTAFSHRNISSICSFLLGKAQKTCQRSKTPGSKTLDYKTPIAELEGKTLEVQVYADAFLPTDRGVRIIGAMGGATGPPGYTVQTDDNVYHKGFIETAKHGSGFTQGRTCKVREYGIGPHKALLLKGYKLLQVQTTPTPRTKIGSLDISKPALVTFVDDLKKAFTAVVKLDVTLAGDLAGITFDRNKRNLRARRSTNTQPQKERNKLHIMEGCLMAVARNASTLLRNQKVYLGDSLRDGRKTMANITGQNAGGKGSRRRNGRRQPIKAPNQLLNKARRAGYGKAATAGVKRKGQNAVDEVGTNLAKSKELSKKSLQTLRRRKPSEILMNCLNSIGRHIDQAKDVEDLDTPVGLARIASRIIGEEGKMKQLDLGLSYYHLATGGHYPGAIMAQGTIDLAQKVMSLDLHEKLLMTGKQCLDLCNTGTSMFVSTAVSSQYFQNRLAPQVLNVVCGYDPAHVYYILNNGVGNAYTQFRSLTKDREDVLVAPPRLDFIHSLPVASDGVDSDTLPDPVTISSLGGTGVTGKIPRVSALQGFDSRPTMAEKTIFVTLRHEGTRPNREVSSRWTTFKDVPLMFGEEAPVAGKIENPRFWVNHPKAWGTFCCQDLSGMELTDGETSVPVYKLHYKGSDCYIPSSYYVYMYQTGTNPARLKYGEILGTNYDAPAVAHSLYELRESTKVILDGPKTVGSNTYKFYLGLHNEYQNYNAVNTEYLWAVEHEEYKGEGPPEPYTSQWVCEGDREDYFPYLMRPDEGDDSMGGGPRKL